MRVFIRSLWAVVLALASTVALAVAWTTATAVQLLATALIMGGTDHPLSTPPDDPVSFINPYMDNAILGYINPAAGAPTGTEGEGIEAVGPDDDRYAVIYPAEFFPVSGLTTFDASVADGRDNLNGCIRGTGCDYNQHPDIEPAAPAAPPAAGDDFVAFGYSQSAVVASLVKRDLIDNPPPAGTNVSFFLLANAMRPNGGILARGPQGLTIPILGVTFYGATPTNSCETGTCYPTVDVAQQYDILGGDAPASLTNILAILNAGAGYLFLHGALEDRSFDDSLYQGSHGDTDYYLVPAQRLPLLMPFQPFIPSPILTALDAPLRVLIEGAYPRDINPGIATGVGLLPFLNPIQTILNLIAAIPTGIDDALAEATGNPAFRPLGTAPATSPFGVGGPDLPDPPAALTDATAMDASAFSTSAAADNDAEAVVLEEQPDANEPDPPTDLVGRNDDEAVADASEGDESPDDGEAAEEDAVEEDGVEEQAEAPSDDQPDDETPTGEPDRAEDDADGGAGADGEAAA